MTDRNFPAGRRYTLRSWQQYRFRGDLIDAIVMRPTKFSDVRAFSEASGEGDS